MKFIILVSLLILTKQENYQPVLGVIAYPSEFPQFDQKQYNQVPKSYVDWLQNAGARIIPIPYDIHPQELLKILSLVNGLLFPGGFHQIYEQDKKTSQITQQLEQLLSSVLSFEQNYKQIPMFFVQNSMSLFVAIIDKKYPGSRDAFRYYKAEDLNANIRFTFNHQSTIWSKTSNKTLDAVTKMNATYYYHNSSLSIESFLQNKFLRDNFDITAQSLDRLGWWLVASMQHKTLPIYCTQFFPNAPNYEWDSNLQIPHIDLAQDFGNSLATFFVSECSKQPQITEDIQDLLIKNHEPSYSEVGVHGQIYFIRK